MNEPAKIQSGRRRLLRRATLGVAVILFILASAIGALNAWFWYQDLERNEKILEHSRTREGHLPEEYGLEEIFGFLPPFEQMPGNGLRFVAHPNFGTTDYVVAFLPPNGASEAEAVLVMFNKTEGGDGKVRRFTVPAEVFGGLVNEFRWVTEDWPGSTDDLCIDGAPVAFELKLDNRITSGSGNCSVHYRYLGLLVLDVVRRFGPGDDLPTESDWHRFAPEYSTK